MAFSSGVGSISEAADVYVERMREIIGRHQDELRRRVRVVDLGVGDFAIGRRLLDACDIDYVGCDIVPELIDHHKARSNEPNASFMVRDIVTDELPDGDICLVRQVLQHLTNANVSAVLGKLSKYRHVYITEGHPVSLEGVFNPDKPVGSGVRFDFQTGRGRGLEFDQRPFNLPTEELFRIKSAPVEWVVTYRVHCAADEQVADLGGERR